MVTIHDDATMVMIFARSASYVHHVKTSTFELVASTENAKRLYVELVRKGRLNGLTMSQIECVVVTLVLLSAQYLDDAFHSCEFMALFLRVFQSMSREHAIKWQQFTFFRLLEGQVDAVAYCKRK
jgi:hypothetical protein